MNDFDNEDADLDLNYEAQTLVIGLHLNSFNPAQQQHAASAI